MSQTLPGSIEVGDSPDSLEAVLGDLAAMEDLVTRFTETIVHRLRFHLHFDATGKRLRYVVSLFTRDLRRKFIDHIRSHASGARLAAFEVQSRLDAIPAYDVPVNAADSFIIDTTPEALHEQVELDDEATEQSGLVLVSSQ